MRGVYIVKSKSNRATCEVCWKPIRDEIRIYNVFSTKYVHIYCAGFMYRKLKTLKGWDTLDPWLQGEDYINELLEHTPR